MATITANISASDTTIPVSAEIDNGFYTLDSENVYVHGSSRGAQGRAFDRLFLSVDRGVGGSTAATHTSGATLTRYYPDAATAGGGTEIDATDGQIVYMDGTDAVGSANLTWTEVGRVLGLAAGANEGASVEGIGVGVQLVVRGADGDATHVGGELTLESGGSAGQSGGQLNIKAGDDTDGGDGGNITIYSGAGTDGTSGDIDIRVGGSGASADGGNILISAGTAQTGDGGNVQIEAGGRMTSGDYGSVAIYEGSGNVSIYMDVAGVAVGGGLINFSGLPSVDPGVAGQLYTDGVPSAGVPKALMVSGG